MVLGRPGSGCSTLLKTIAGETHGFFIDQKSEINYQGIPKELMHKDFRGECMYQAEVDVHFPQLTVGQTLDFAAQARAPRNRIPGVTRKQYAKHMTDVIMAVFGLSHTVNTRVGNDFVRGVSGGERKRVSIAEAALGGSPLQCWDNSTRGLDSATALEFVKTLRISTSLAGSTAAVAIYQASQSIYDIFDKVVVLYEGRQIYFGHTTAAKDFFVNMGFVCAERATTGDFLTSLTNPAERVVKEGYENRVPKTPDEFAAVWQQSEERARLLQEIGQFDKDYPLGGEQLERFKHARKAQQAKKQYGLVRHQRGIFTNHDLQAGQVTLYPISNDASQPLHRERFSKASRRYESDAIRHDRQFCHGIDHWQCLLQSPSRYRQLLLPRRSALLCHIAQCI